MSLLVDDASRHSFGHTIHSVKLMHTRITSPRRSTSNNSFKGAFWSVSASESSKFSRRLLQSTVWTPRHLRICLMFISGITRRSSSALCHAMSFTSLGIPLTTSGLSLGRRCSQEIPSSMYVV